MVKKKSIKKRNWAFIMYPESAVSDWKEQLNLSGLNGAISPLHDNDFNADNTPKKPHYHVIICYDGPTTYANVSALTSRLNGTIPQALDAIKGYYRYFTHRDNPEKAQYSEEKIQTFGKFDIMDYIDYTKSEMAEIKRKIQAFICEKDIVEYCDLLDFLLAEDLLEEHDVAQCNTLLFNTYIRSRRNKKSSADNSSKIKKINVETGEIF